MWPVCSKSTPCRHHWDAFPILADDWVINWRIWAVFPVSVWGRVVLSSESKRASPLPLGSWWWIRNTEQHWPSSQWFLIGRYWLAHKPNSCCFVFALLLLLLLLLDPFRYVTSIPKFNRPVIIPFSLGHSPPVFPALGRSTFVTLLPLESWRYPGLPLSVGAPSRSHTGEQ